MLLPNARLSVLMGLRLCLGGCVPSTVSPFRIMNVDRGLLVVDVP